MRSQLSTINLPQVTAILAISIDGKISLETNIPARFSSAADLAHLEQQISRCDAIIFGANTLRAYGTSLVIKKPELLEQRKQNQQLPQPLNIVCSPSGNLDPRWRFFSQPLPRALLTTKKGKINWQQISQQSDHDTSENELFEQYFIQTEPIDWQYFFSQLKNINYHKIGILGGSQLIFSLLKQKLIDDIWLTICPLIIAKSSSPSLLSIPCNETEFNLPIALELLEMKQIDQEIFVHYLIKQ